MILNSRYANNNISSIRIFVLSECSRLLYTRQLFSLLFTQEWKILCLSVRFQLNMIFVIVFVYKIIFGGDL